jgi:hypothetical protein
MMSPPSTLTFQEVKTPYDEYKIEKIPQALTLNKLARSIQYAKEEKNRKRGQLRRQGRTSIIKS